MEGGVLGLRGVLVPRGKFVALSYPNSRRCQPVTINVFCLLSGGKIVKPGSPDLTLTFSPPGAPTIDVEPAPIHIHRQVVPIAEVATRWIKCFTPIAEKHS